MAREKGKVKWFNNSKGYGFIARNEGEDIFVHYSAIKVEGYKTLKEGQEVEFTVSTGEKGLQAEDVVPVEG
ncbi:MAG: cold-shock protein [Lentisphaeria bacterium]|nr:cold-shock protein [Lentisphaeria bacterium]